MRSLLSAILLFSLRAGDVDGIQCYQCTYNNNPYGVGTECMTDGSNGTIPVTDCPMTCQESVTLYSDNSVFTFSRGCAVNGSISCCQNQNSLVACYSVCDDGDLCNNASYGQSSPINSQSRCPAPVVIGSIPCNSCEYNGGGTDTSCLYSPLSARVGYVQCPTDTNDCTIKSMRPIADETEVWSYERGCHPIGFLPYGITEDSNYITWICHCETPYCNDNVGDGTQAECHPTDGSGDGGTNHGGANYRLQSNRFTAVQLIVISIVCLLQKQ